MRLLANYAQRVARERGQGGVETKWSYRGTLRDGPAQLILTVKSDGHSQDAAFPREAVEDYPGAVGVARTQAVVDICLQRLRAAVPRERK